MEHTNTVPRYIMGYTIILASFSLVVAMMIFAIPRANRDIIFAAAGMLLAWGTTVVQYEFGSSRKTGTQAVTVENKANDPIPVEAK